MVTRARMAIGVDRQETIPSTALEDVTTGQSLPSLMTAEQAQGEGETCAF